MDKLVSIIVLCYNHENYILDNLESIVKQTYKNIQVLINDDCSTDRSWDLISMYEEHLKSRFADVQIHRNDINLGITKSINNMLSKAKGDVIKLIAGDDFFEETYVERVLELIEEGADVVMSNAYYISDDSSFNNPKIIDLVYKSNPVVSHKRLFERIFEFNFICAPSVALSRRVIQSYGFFDESLPVEDLEYWLRITKDDKLKFWYLEDPLVFYRKSSNSMTSVIKNDRYESRNITMYSSSIAARKKYKTYLSGIKYRILICKLIRNYMIKAQDENLMRLQKICTKDADELGFVVGVGLRIWMRMRLFWFEKK